ncbi:RHS repeat-associated core domain-containing protein [Pseudomonas sp. S2_E01]
MNTVELHQHTPSLSVIDPRGLGVRGVAYWREEVGQAAAARSTRQVFDGAGRLAEQWDARLTVAALGQYSSLSGKVLASDSVDAGWRVSQYGEADQVLAGWNGRGHRADIEYDTSLRTVAVSEQGRVVERFEYGGVESSDANQCGRVVRHDDPAGTRHMSEYDLLGRSQCEVSHFLQTLDSPDWPLDVAARDALLEGEPGLASRWAYSPLGDLLSLTDAHGHCRHFIYSVGGQLSQGWLQPANTPAPGQCLVRDIRYNPNGKVERETAGNGVVTVADYALSDGRLERLSAGLPNAEPLQDLRYTVDPVGSIVQIDDHALPIRYFKNQRIDPQRLYVYDTLGQLISATGWEAASPGAILNYREAYGYDAGGNMTELRHVGAQSFTRLWAVAPDSNRSLIDDDQSVDFPSQFDANGNLQFLQRGQTMSWDLRNQLASVSPVVREEEDDDTERYIYGGGGKRLRKVRTALTNATAVFAEVRYLPGLELHRRPTGEQYQVLDLDAGRNRVTWIHGPDAPAHPLRYHLTDHLGSGTLELDEHTNVQSREAYYPFGGTAWEDHSDQAGAYKTIRYSGKERDATGLYYYGFRYYAPWLSRWINPDPAGAVDGLNFYGFVDNSPIGHVDADGLIKQTRGEFFEAGGELRSRGQHERDRETASIIEARELEQAELQAQAEAQVLARVHGQARKRSQARARQARATVREEKAFLELAGDQSPPIAVEEIELAPLPPIGTPTNDGPVSTDPQATPQREAVPGPSSAIPNVPPDPKICPYCQRTFPRPSLTKIHERSHTGEKPYKCTLCSAGFSQKGNLKKHLMNHDGIKLFSCKNCGLGCVDKTALTRHMQTHSTQRNFHCELCNSSFKQKRGLDSHMKTHENT